MDVALHSDSDPQLKHNTAQCGTYYMCTCHQAGINSLLTMPVSKSVCCVTDNYIVGRILLGDSKEEVLQVELWLFSILYGEGS